MYLVESDEPCSEKEGYCDTAVRTSTSGTGAVRTQFVHAPDQPVTHPTGTLRLSYLSVSLISSLIATHSLFTSLIP